MLKIKFSIWFNGSWDWNSICWILKWAMKANLLNSANKLIELLKLLLGMQHPREYASMKYGTCKQIILSPFFHVIEHSIERKQRFSWSSFSIDCGWQTGNWVEVKRKSYGWDWKIYVNVGIICKTFGKQISHLYLPNKHPRKLKWKESLLIKSSSEPSKKLLTTFALNSFAIFPWM